MSGSFYDQTADGLIGHTMLPGIKVLLDQVLSLHVFPGKNQFTHLGQTSQCLRLIIPVRAASPHGFIIQLEFFTSRSAIHHRSHPGIANRKRLHPRPGRLLIPQFQVTRLNG